MALGDARLDSWAPGGVPAPRFVAGWWDYLHSRWASVEASARAEGDAGCLARLDRNRETAEPYRLSNVILQHPLRDDFIEQRHIAARTGRIDVPVLSMEAFQDEAVTSRQGHYHDTLAPDRLWLVQTNGGHDLYESKHFRALLIAFFDRFVKGRANGFEAGPHVRVWMESASNGEGHARQEAVLPRYELAFPRFPVPVRPVNFTLDAGGLLSATTGSGAADSMAYPLPGPAVNAEEGPERWGALAADWRKGSLAYTSPPLQAALLAYGSASADLWVSSTATDADLQVTLTEAQPGGQEVFVQRGWLRLSDRALDPARSTQVRPMLLDRPETIAALTPGEPVLARIEINKFAHAFRPGSRLRLWIETPGLWGGYGFSPQSLPATVSVWHDAAHPSRLVLGTLDPAQVPPVAPACGTLLGQPCRTDPLAP
jgi:predicted acyl esterase